jgi:hypothetical protein
MDERDLEGGERINGFVIVRNRDGDLHALRGGAISGLSNTDGSTVVALYGGRCLIVDRPLLTVLSWFGPGVGMPR